MLLELINIISLASLGFIDYVSFKIPNVVLCGWLGTILIMNIINNITTPISLDHTTVIASILVTGSYYPLRHLVKCSAGDFKLYGTLTAIVGFDNSLWVIFISSIIEVFPLASGIKTIPIATYTFFGYIAFLLLKMRGIL